MTGQYRLAIIVWLGLCACLIFFMILLGGAVRLTGSGLSMVDWKPLTGIIPPLGAMQWQQAFDKYKQFAEFQFVNQDMVLVEFQFIFLMEYAHRVLGRIIGFVFFVPFVFFLFKQCLSAPLIGRLWLLFCLGAAQGVVGWYMVKSGLVDDPHVSQYRLMLHFMLAVIIYAYMIRLLVGLLPAFRLSGNPSLNYLAVAVLIVLLVMMSSGALVAGTRAGFIFNTYPKMGLEWVPSQLFSMTPMWLNFFENPVTIQFLHRWLAMLVLLGTVFYAIRIFHSDKSNFATQISIILVAVAVVQVILGIVTLLLHVPSVLAVTHQAGALILLTVVVVSLAARFQKWIPRQTG